MVMPAAARRAMSSSKMEPLSSMKVLPPPLSVNVAPDGRVDVERLGIVLSGSTADTPKFIIESDATIVAPLIFASVLEQ